MTTLFYPSIAAFIERGFDAPSSHPASPIPSSNAASTSWRPIQDAFYPDPPPLLPNVDWGPWWAPEGDRAWVAAQCSSGSPSSTPEIDVLRIAWADVGEVLDGEVGESVSLLKQLRKLADEWEDGARCVRHLVPHKGEVKEDGSCYIISPDGAEGTTPHAALWGSSEDYNLIYRTVAVPFHVQGDRQIFEDKWNAKLAQALAPLGAEVFTESWPRGAGNSTTLVSVSSGRSERNADFCSSRRPLRPLLRRPNRRRRHELSLCCTRCCSLVCSISCRGTLPRSIRQWDSHSQASFSSAALP